MKERGEQEPCRVVENVACTVCGCVCDDLRISVLGETITAMEPYCPLAEPWFLQAGQRNHPVAEIGGQPATLEKAFDLASDYLQSARYPLIYGLSRSSTAGQQRATELADFLGATIDTTASLCHAPSVMALQVTGESTCTLGEVKNRADLVIFWGADPLQTHPRHGERYSIDPRGLFIPEGRSERNIVVVDVRETATSKLADQFLRVEPGQDFEALTTLRGLIRGLDPEPGTSTGLPLPLLQDLARRMRSCRFGIIFFGLGLSMSQLGHRNVEQLLYLVAELNDYTRFYARRLRIQGDVTGADTVLAWQTGYPFSVNLARGYPRYNPGEFSAQEQLERGEPDMCLLIGSEGIAKFSQKARDYLRTIPTIVLDYPHFQSTITPTIRFTTAIYGVHLPGTAYRMDEVPIPLQGFLPGNYPSDEEVLEKLLSKLKSRRLD